MIRETVPGSRFLLPNAAIDKSAAKILGYFHHGRKFPFIRKKRMKFATNYKSSVFLFKA